MNDRTRLQTEFGRYTEWIVEAVEALRIADPVPVVCRGTGHPDLLEQLADAIQAAPGTSVLDVGCGMGGPAAWLRANRGCATAGVDVMEANVHAARTLFGDRAAVVATAEALPFPGDSFDACWAIGVLEMIEDKTTALREIARVVKPRGTLAVYSFTTSGGELVDPPRSDVFVTGVELRSAVAQAGLEVAAAVRTRSVGPLPEEWRGARSAVAEHIREWHGDEADYEAVRLDLERFNRLRASRDIEAWRFTLVKEGR